MLIKSEQSLLLLIDLQERLAPAIDDIDAVLRHNRWLVEIAQHLGVPVAATVQYPAGLGPMDAALTALVPAARVAPAAGASRPWATTAGRPRSAPALHTRRKLTVGEGSPDAQSRGCAQFQTSHGQP